MKNIKLSENERIKCLKIYMMITVAIVPIIVVYLLLSKYIIAGVTLGGVKE